MIENLSIKDLADILHHDGLYIVDRDRRITYWNKAAEQITGYKSEEVVGKSCADNVLTHVDKNGNNMCSVMCPMAKTIEEDIPRETELYLHHKDGHRLSVFIRVAALKDDKGQIIGGVELFSDISQQVTNRLKIVELEKLAMLDELTQLANRRYIETEMHARLEEKKREGIPFGVLLIDIDHFKKFNDDYGHATGDRVLKAVAEGFIAHARPFDLYGRWGGEEFMAIIRNVDREELRILGERVRLLIEKSYIMHDTKRLEVTATLGGTAAQPNDTKESLFKRVDALLYRGKQSGRNRLITG